MELISLGLTSFDLLHTIQGDSQRVFSGTGLKHRSSVLSAFFYQLTHIFHDYWKNPQQLTCMRAFVQQSSI